MPSLIGMWWLIRFDSDNVVLHFPNVFLILKRKVSFRRETWRNLVTCESWFSKSGLGSDGPRDIAICLSTEKFAECSSTFHLNGGQWPLLKMIRVMVYS